MQKVFSNSDPAQLEAAEVGKAAYPTWCTTQKCKRRFPIDDVEEEDIIVVPEVLPKRSGNEQVLVLRSTATDTANISEAWNDEEEEKDDQTKGEERSTE